MRIELQNLSVGLGNAVLADRVNWPLTGEGREIKAATERMTRMLDATFDRDIQHVFDNLGDVVGILKRVRNMSYFETNIASRLYRKRAGDSSPFMNVLDDHIDRIVRFSEANRPIKSEMQPAVIRSNIRLQPIDGAIADKSADLLRDITPAQQAGPLQFEVRNGSLHIKSQLSYPEPRDLKNIRSARKAMKDSSVALLGALSESNCDPRLIEAVDEINSIVQSKTDVIRLGLVNITCDQLFERAQKEIPDTALARFKGLSVAIGLYVAQFPEWQRFTENAARADFDPADIQKTYEVGRQLLPQLKSASGLVDPEVPRSIELVLEALRNPNHSGRRALYGTVRTLENLFAKIFSEFVGLLNSAFDGARSGIKKGITIAAAAALLTAAAHYAGMLSPTAERVLKATWIKQAADLVSKSLTVGT